MPAQKEMRIDYPVLFTFRDAISGNGFLAGITVTGQALIVKEDDDKWWMYGVRPASIAEFGDTPGEVFSNFRKSFKEVLFDVADEVSEYAQFEKEVDRFFYEPDHIEERRWHTAYCLFRDGKVQPEAPFFSALPKQSPDSRPTSLSVTRLDNVTMQARYSATDNVQDLYFLGTAA